MAYQLKQTPVPIWAVTSPPPPLNVDSSSLPVYFFDDHEKDAFSTASSGPTRPPSLEQRGRWNSVIGPYTDPSNAKLPSKEGTGDPSLLDHYDLTSEWENRLAKEEEDRTGIANFERMRERALKILQGSPFVPIVLRGSSAMHAAISLGLACAVFVQTKKVRDPFGFTGPSGLGQPASTIYAIVILSMSTAYLFYELWDETFGQPLGLRRSRSKMRNVMFDLLLLCLMSANSALAFDTMINRDYICPAAQNHRICKLQKALVSFILVTIVTWFLTFLVSGFRMIDRAAH